MPTFQRQLCQHGCYRIGQYPNSRFGCYERRHEDANRDESASCEDLENEPEHDEDEVEWEEGGCVQHEAAGDVRVMKAEARVSGGERVRSKASGRSRSASPIDDTSSRRYHDRDRHD